MCTIYHSSDILFPFLKVLHILSERVAMDKKQRIKRGWRKPFAYHIERPLLNSVSPTYSSTLSFTNKFASSLDRFFPLTDLNMSVFLLYHLMILWWIWCFGLELRLFLCDYLFRLIYCGLLVRIILETRFSLVYFNNFVFLRW